MRRCSTRTLAPPGRPAAYIALLAAVCAASVSACGARSVAVAETDPVPHLAIVFDGDFPTAAGERGAREDLPARLQVGSTSAAATLAVSGWTTAPRSAPKPQIEVRVKRKQRLLGMRRFSLRDPAAVGFQKAPLLFEHLRREGVLAPRIQFVRVSANGADLGLMALEEHFSKELLESQRRREGVMFRLRPGSLPVAQIEVFGARDVAGSKQLSAERVTAAGLLQAFLRGELPARDVFDEALTARFLAIAELWQSESLLRAGNLRFYFNPVTQRLEPIGCNAVLELRPDGEDRLVSRGGWASQLLADGPLRAAALRDLQRLAGEMAGGELPRWLAAEEERLLGLLRTEYAFRDPVALDPWIARARLLSALAETDLAGGAPAGAGDRLIAAPDVASRTSNPIPAASVEAVRERHPFLAFDPERRTWRAAPGTWAVRGSLVLPEGHGLELAAGTTLRFGEGELLLASGPLRFRGSEATPVVLEGVPVGSRAGTWQGIVVLRSGAPHEWEHVVVRNTTGIDRDTWRLTGGVTIRASEARIDRAVFVGNRAEDALNLIRSEFDFRDVAISEVASDAFDCDFCEGRWAGGRLRGVGGDGIDVSGSVVLVTGVEFENIRDKAISVGEGSHLIARGVRIRDVGTGVAGKDGSEVIFEDSQVENARFAAIMAYTKKAEYGPGQVSARGIQMKGVARTAIAQHGSRIRIDGVEQAAEDLDVEGLYKRGPMKK